MCLFSVNGLMRFQYGNPVLSNLFNYIAGHFDGRSWGANGPTALSRVLMDTCHINAYNTTSHSGGLDCFNITAYPAKWFDPIGWQDHGLIFDENQKERVISALNGSYTLHLSNFLSHDIRLNITEDTAFRSVARQNCPLSAEKLR